MNKENCPVWWKKLDDLSEKLDNITLWDRSFIDDCIHERRKSGWKPNKKQRETLDDIHRSFFTNGEAAETLWEDDPL